jgi:cardiolipin synthase (CMP-forming)
MCQSVRNDRPRVEPNAGWTDALTFANGLSLLRMVLGLCFPWCPSSWRLPMIVGVVLTDLLDGPTARFLRVHDGIGRVLDPVADKVFAAAVLGTFVAEGTVTIGDVVLVGMRDLVVMLGTLVGLGWRMWPSFRRMSPTLLGKATTAAQFAFLLSVVADIQYRDLVLALAASLSTLAGGHYLWSFLTLRSSKTPDGPQHKEPRCG